MTPTFVIISTVLTSAVISAFIAGFFAWLNERNRRISEERRFTLDAALQIVKVKNEQTIQIIALAQKGGMSMNVHYADPLINLIWYRKHLELLMKGRFSKVEKEFSKELEEIETKWRKGSTGEVSAS